MQNHPDRPIFPIIEPVPVELDLSDLLPAHERFARAFVLAFAAIMLACAIAVLAYSIRQAPPVGLMGDMGQ